jgi:hypothetical protein
VVWASSIGRKSLALWGLGPPVRHTRQDHWCDAERFRRRAGRRRRPRDQARVENPEQAAQPAVPVRGGRWPGWLRGDRWGQRSRGNPCGGSCLSVSVPPSRRELAGARTSASCARTLLGVQWTRMAPSPITSIRFLGSGRSSLKSHQSTLRLVRYRRAQRGAILACCRIIGSRTFPISCIWPADRGAVLDAIDARVWADARCSVATS